MLTTKRACELARGLVEVTEYDHFGSDAFRTKNGTFATVWHSTRTVNLKLTPEQQQRYVAIDGEGFVEIDNAWGRQGWTTARLEFVAEEDFRRALESAWTNSNAKRARPPRKTRSRRRASEALPR